MRSSQRIIKFQQGQALQFAGWCGPLLWGTPEAMVWNGGPRCLVRSYNLATLLVAEPPTETRPHSRLARQEYRAPGGQRLKGLALPPAGDGFVVLHVVPAGTAVVTVRGGRVVASRTHSDAPYDGPVLTDGRRILVAPCGTPPLWYFEGWDLERREPWSLAPLERALGLGGARLRVTELLLDGDRVLLGTDESWSWWSWEGRLLAVKRTPHLGFSHSQVLCWRGDGPIFRLPEVYAPGQQPSGWHEQRVVQWDLAAERERRFFGLVRDDPVGALSPDGRWLVLDRVTREGRALELWDVQTAALIERLPTRRRAVRAMAFAPGDCELAVATMADLFVLRVAHRPTDAG